MKTRGRISLFLSCLSAIANVFAQSIETSAVTLNGMQSATVMQGTLDMNLYGCTISADSLSSTAPTTFYVYSLHSEQLPPVPSTLKVVTGGKSQGYRLLPSGEHFPKGATLRLAYDPAKIPAGHSFRDIRTYYYDEVSRQWKALKLIDIDTTKHEVVSLSTHFTDFINGVMQEPEAPEVEGFVPTTMSKRPAAEPLTGLPLFTPPSANSSGTAETNIPIAIPAGRGGLQPTITLTYSNGGGDGWLGTGWDIHVQKISVETRWGVPRYNPAKESETYIYAGNQLVTKDNNGHFEDMPHRTNKWLARKPSGTRFYPRIEGAFDKITRHGDRPWNYWWEVTDRNGVKYFYGKMHSSDNVDITATLRGNHGMIAEWYLTEVLDPNGNTVRYSYTEYFSNNGRQVCLSMINYTGHSNTHGDYDVLFETEQVAAGQGSDCRYGFKNDNARLLKTIRIMYQGRIVAAYLFGYENGDSTMYRNRLCGFARLDSTMYNIHQNTEDEIDAIHSTGLCNYPFNLDFPNLWYYAFDYYNAPNAANLFGNENVIHLNNDEIYSYFITAPFNISGMGSATALGATKSENIGVGGGADIGAGANVALTTTSAGGNYNANWSRSTGLMTLMDLDGDGLPDKVFKTTDGVYYRKHIRDNETSHHYAPPERIEGMDNFLEEKSFSSSWGIQASVGVGGINGSYSTDKSRTRVYFSDVNGDGLPDLVTPDGVKFNQLDNGVPSFTTTADQDGTVATNTMPCGVVIHDGEVNNSILCYIEKEVVCGGAVNEDLAYLMERLLGGDELTEEEISTIMAYSYLEDICEECFRGTGHYFEYNYISKEFVCYRLTTICERNNEPQLDAVRVWVAPTDGDIQITSNLQLDNNGNTLHNADGVWCCIQHESDVTCQSDLLQSATSDTLWSIELAKDDYDQHTKNIQLFVKQGDVLMFRLNSKNNRNADNILWDNTIEYENTPQDNDRYGKPGNRYNSAEDFVMSDKAYFQAVTAGAVQLRDNPTISSGDTALYKVYKNNNLIRLDTLMENRNLVIDTQIIVAKDDSIKIEIAALHSDSIQWDAVSSFPTVDLTPNAGDTLIKDILHYDFVPKLLINNAFCDVYHSLFGPLYRGWGQFAFLNDSNDMKNSPIMLDQLIVPDYQAHNTASSNPLPTITDTSYSGVSTSLSGRYNPVAGGIRHVAMTANATTKGWMGFGNTTHVMQSKMSNVRKIATTLPQGLDPSLMEDMDSPIPQTLSGGNANFVEKESKAKPLNGGITLASIVGLNRSETSNNVTVDYLDINGDRYPDVVSRNSVQYSMPWGGLGGFISFDNTSTESNSSAKGLSFGMEYPDTKRITGNAPRNAKFTTASNSLSGTSAKDKTVKGWLDVNGDGLPDRVYANGKVALNIGYGFLPAENWGMGLLRKGESTSSSLSNSVIGCNIFNVQDGSIRGGIGISLSRNSSTTVYQDINGDGLPDCIVENGGIYVSFNKGDGTWTTPSLLTNVGNISKGENYSENVSAGVTAGFTLLLAKITGSLNASGGHSFNRETATLTDINGDGLPDYVTSDAENVMKVRYNQGGKANLLKRVTNFTGSGFTVDYTLTPPTYDNPQRQWVMAQTVTFDSFAVQRGTKLKTTYEYRNARYDRYERMSYGFDSVITRQHDTLGNVYRCYIDGYNNRNFMKHGQKVSDMITDGSGRPYVENLYQSKLQDLNNPVVIYDNPDCPVEAFPFVDAEITNYYEGSALPTITTARSYTYDNYKNVISYLDRGDISRSDDDITVNFMYHIDTATNLISLPTEQMVLDQTSNLLRHRKMQYDILGRPIHLDIMGEADYSTISMTYDAYGNIASVLMPENAAGQRYARYYTYDPVLNTYPAKVSNSFGEACTFEYDYSRGLCTKQTDPNGNSIETEYDWLWRPVKVTAPQELADGARYTLKIRYSPARWYGYVRADHSSAISMRYDPQNPTDSIVSVAICDGWGRALQTKTEYNTYGSVVSGRCVYDPFGRVSTQYHPFFGNAADSTYDPYFDPNTATTTSYDVLDRKTAILRPDGHGQGWVYGFQNHNGMRFATAVTDANNNTTVSYADVRGNTLKVEAPENATTLFEYDALGRTTETIDPDGFVTTYSYDLRGRLTSTAHPDKGTTTMTYDKAGNLTHKSTQKLANQGVDIEYVYDYNRLAEVRYPLLPQNNVTYTYGNIYNTGTNACGRLLRVDDGTGYQTFAYDRLGNVAENTRTIALPFEDSVYNFRMLFEYDSWNRIQRIVYPDSEVVSYSYNTDGELYSVSSLKGNIPSSLINGILYDEFGHRTQVNFGNGVSTNYTYDILQRLSGLNTYSNNANVSLQKILYSFDYEDNITEVKNTASGANGLGGDYINVYYYDGLYRLSSANGGYIGNNSNYSLEMAYTPAGRLCSKFQDYTATANTYAYSPNAKPHAVRRYYNGLTNELYNLRWDNNGNLAQQTLYSVNNNVPSYQTMRMLFWDEDDRLNLVAGDGYLSYYAYGYDGNRAIKMTGTATIDPNGTLINTGDLNNITIYPNEYLSVTQAEYTKYYYAGGNRIASKIGTGGFEKMQQLCTQDLNLSTDANTLFDNVLQQAVNTTNPPTDEYPVDVCAGYSVATELLTNPLPDFYISQTNLNFTQNNLLQQFRQNLAGGAEAVYFFHSDHLGSASWITNNTGLPVQHLLYLPFGEHFANEHSSGYDERFTFTGKERDAETGYYYHGARFNSSDIGWISVDPKFDKYPSLTPYNYCAWNPVKFIDPDGRKIKNAYECYKQYANHVSTLKSNLKNASNRAEKKIAKKELKKNQDIVNGYESYMKVQSMLDKFKEKNSSEYDRVDNLKLMNKEIDVVVGLNEARQSDEGAYGLTTYIYLMDKENIVGIKDNTIQIEIYRFALSEDNGVSTLANEFGDAIFAVENPGAAYKNNDKTYYEQPSTFFSFDYEYYIMEKRKDLPKPEDY